MPLLQGGAWIRDSTFDVNKVGRNGLPGGSYVIVRRGNASVLHGLVGYMRQGTVYMKTQSTTVGLHVAKLINWKRDRFERQGNGIAVPMRAGEDEYALAAGVLTVQSTVTVRADLVEEELTCDNLCEGVTCVAQNKCHTAGVCDPGTGQCSNPAKPDGAQGKGRRHGPARGQLKRPDRNRWWTANSASSSRLETPSLLKMFVR